MAGETVITIVGNLTADPELRTTRDGGAVANFSIAATPRVYDRQSNQWVDGDALFLRCTAWRDLAEHCANSLAKGMRVIAQGRLQQRSYQANDGSQRTVIELQVDEIGPSLRYATAQVTRTSSANGGNFAGNRGGNAFAGGNGGFNNGGFAGNAGGYQGGAGYSGGAGYQGGAAAPANAAPAVQPAPASDPWGNSDNSGSSSFGSFGSSEFGGSSDEPEF